MHQFWQKKLKEKDIDLKESELDCQKKKHLKIKSDDKNKQSKTKHGIRNQMKDLLFMKMI